MTQAYSQIPGVVVRCLKFRAKDLNIGSILSLMSVTSTGTVPLYIQQVSKILRDMASDGMSDFDYSLFKQLLKATQFSPDQSRPLEMRLGLLESFLLLDDAQEPMEFEPGEVTIIDMSCPFLDEPTACVLFDICLGLYLGDRGSQIGKVVALDEAHKVRDQMAVPVAGRYHWCAQLTCITVYEQQYGCQDFYGESVIRDSTATTLRSSRDHLHSGAQHIPEDTGSLFSDSRSSLFKPRMAFRSEKAHLH